MNRYLLPAFVGTLATITLVQTVAISFPPSDVNPREKQLIVPPSSANIPQTSPTSNKESVINLYDPNYAQDGIIAGRSGPQFVLTPDEKKIITYGTNNINIRIWDLATGKLERTLTGHSDGVNSVAISPDGRTLVSGSDDTDIRVWRLAP